ncbi:MAG: hypothetical protein WDN02_02750 [Methylovirgula sp.]|uniref:hypothetical protein n=1 Tax=Methylovirgula sp. TaxID=1978224 RepID=UPI003076769D
MKADHPEVRLENWRLVTLPNDPNAVLVGTVTGHPRIQDGRRTLTTQIVEMAPDKSWARTLNTHYVLGEPMPEEEEFDDRIKAGIERRIWAWPHPSIANDL